MPHDDINDPITFTFRFNGYHDRTIANRTGGVKMEKVMSEFKNLSDLYSGCSIQDFLAEGEVLFFKQVLELVESEALDKVRHTTAARNAWRGEFSISYKDANGESKYLAGHFIDKRLGVFILIDDSECKMVQDAVGVPNGNIRDMTPELVANRIIEIIRR